MMSSATKVTDQGEPPGGDVSIPAPHNDVGDSNGTGASLSVAVGSDATSSSTGTTTIVKDKNSVQSLPSAEARKRRKAIITSHRQGQGPGHDQGAITGSSASLGTCDTTTAEVSIPLQDIGNGEEETELEARTDPASLAALAPVDFFSHGDEGQDDCDHAVDAQENDMVSRTASAITDAILLNNSILATAAYAENNSTDSLGTHNDGHDAATVAPETTFVSLEHGTDSTKETNAVLPSCQDTLDQPLMQAATAAPSVRAMSKRKLEPNSAHGAHSEMDSVNFKGSRSSTMSDNNDEDDGDENASLDDNNEAMMRLTDAAMSKSDDDERGKKTQIRYDPAIPMEKEQLAAWRREARRVRNRESAAASRQRIRGRISELEDEVNDWKHKYESAVVRLQQLEEGSTGGSSGHDKGAIKTASKG